MARKSSFMGADCKDGKSLHKVKTEGAAQCNRRKKRLASGGECRFPECSILPFSTMTNLVTRRWTAAAAAMLLLMPGLAGQGAAELPRGSYQLMDYGPVIAETVTAEWPAENTAHKGLAVRLAHQSTMIFDTDLMRWSAGAVDGWIDLS